MATVTLCNVDMQRVKERSMDVPIDDVPPELLRLLPHDSDLDKTQIQKAATPVAEAQQPERAGILLRCHCS